MTSSGGYSDLSERPTIDSGDPISEPPPRRFSPVGRWISAAAEAPATSWVGALVAFGCAVFVLVQLQPQLLIAHTTPAGGDMGAHVWGPAYLRDSLLPNWRLTGWTPDWYAGFPAFQFYMLPPALAVVLLDLVLPYGIALKLVTVAGVIAMPVCAYIMGRLLRLPFPGPPLLAVATVAFLFDRTWTIYGGNIASTMAGEYSFSISLALVLLFFGVLARALDTGRHRGLATLLLALVILCHAIPAFFAVIGGTVLVLLKAQWRRFVFAVPILVLGCLLTAFWSVPFVLRRGYLTDMGWEKLEGLKAELLPPDTRWVLFLAAMGLVLALMFRIRAGVFFAILGVLAAAGFWANGLSEVNIWNARILPFYYLALYLLAAVGVSEAVRSLAVLVDDQPWRTQAVEVGGALLATAAAFVVVALPLHSLPFGQLDGSRYSWGPFDTTDDSFVDSWARWNYSGYERKDAYPEYQAIVSTMGKLGETNGCGRAHWEYEADLNRYGTPMALMLLPYWTHGCIGSMEGLYFESSATTPFHFLTASETSAAPSNPVRDTPERPMPYRGFDMDLGVKHMQLTGVRYYMAFSIQAIDAANQNPELREVAQSGPWHVYEVADSNLVTPLVNQPAVLEGMQEKNPAWQRDAIAWYSDPEALDVLLARKGPASWERVERGEAPERRPLPPVKVSAIDKGDLDISFDVDEIGQPVLVKTSYFPNWKVSGADGPYRVTPNFMVVVPRQHHVKLSYGYTDVDYLGWVATLAGLAALIWLVRRGPVVFPDRPRHMRGPWAHHLGGRFGGGGATAAVEDYEVGSDGWIGLSSEPEEPSAAAERAAQGSQPADGPHDAPSDGGPSGPPFDHAHGDLPDDDPGSLRS